MSAETQLQQQSASDVPTAADVVETQHVSSVSELPSVVSVQTQQLGALKDEIREQTSLNQLLVRREKDTKQYIQQLLQELEKRSNEAVVNAARLRDVVSQLAQTHSSETTEPQPSSPLLQQQQQPEDKIGYKSENFCFF